MITCRQATRLASDAMERRLTAGERLALRLHLPLCPGCRAFRRQLTALRRMAQRYPGDDESGDPPACP